MRTKYWWKFQIIYFDEGWEEWGVPEETEYYVEFSRISQVRYRSRSNWVKRGVQLTSLIAVQTSTVRIWFHLHPPSRTLVPEKSNIKRAIYADKFDPVFWILVIRQHITLSRPITCVLNRRQFSSAHILSGHIFHPPCSSVVEDQDTASPANSTTLPHLPIYVRCPIQYSCPMYYVLCLMPNTVYMSYRLCTMNYVLCDELLYHHAV